MRNLLKSLTLLLLFGVTGCIKEDLDKCPQVNLVFRYDADGTENVIERYIHGATLYIFDRSGSLVMERKLSDEELRNEKGIRFILPEDTYRLVCWGNAEEYSRILLNGHLQDCRLQPACPGNTERIQTFDPLYHALCNIEAVPDKETTVEVKFRSAHIRMEVYVYGFEKRYGADMVPQVRVTGLDTQYDFEMTGDAPGNATIHFPEARWNETEKYYTSFANVLRFTEEYPVSISIHTSLNGLEVFRLQLDELLRKHSVVRNAAFSLDREEVVIPITMDFSGPEINVSIAPPHWEEKPVAPGI